MRRYYSYLIKKTIHVKKLLAVDYLNITKNSNFEEEGHFFHEFAYVDSGSILCTVNNEDLTLNQGDFLLLKPYQSHAYKYNGVDATHLLFVCFECSTSFLDIITGKTTLGEEERAIMSVIFSEAKKAFKFPREKKLTLLDTPAFGSQQLVENYVESLLIYLAREKIDTDTQIRFVSNSKDFNNQLVKDIIQILKEQVYGKITLEEIQKQLYYSKTYLNNNFKKITGDSIMHYYKTLKIEEAKKLIKEGEPVTRVSDKLCFENPNYFSKVFRAVTGLTPTKYKKTI